MNFNPIAIPAILIAITIHEYAHGYIAYRLGDNTAFFAGRLTLNPLKHIDPIGTLMLLFAGFGWAKPVPVNPYNLMNPKRDMVLVSLAGPASNLILAVFFTLVFRLLPVGVFQVGFGDSLFTMLYLTIQFNVVLAWFNLIPLPPLDGFKILAGLLPHRLSAKLMAYEQIGSFFLVGLFLLGALTGISIIGKIFFPFVQFTLSLLLGN